MNWLKLNSLEKFITVKLLLLGLPVLVLVAAIQWQLDVRWQWILVTEFFVLLILAWFIASFKYRVMRAFTRASLHLDSVRQEDYNQFAKSSFSHGKVKGFHLQLNELSHHLQQQKSRYDQHMFLVYQLMSQLESPVMVFNQKQQLTFANDAFFQLYRQPWQVFRHASTEHLNLSFDGQEWQYQQGQNAKWQIKHSEFIEAGESHLLLVFVDIESALRENQLQAWQQIIRVLSHEIRNSLTPVSSMAETLADRSLIERDQQMLRVITDRCLHLQNFVDRYSIISKKISLNRQMVSVTDLEKSLVNIFTPFKVNINQTVDYLWADLTFFEQVMINLIKNAKEANATEVTINVSEHEQHFIIEIIDDGHGFANIDNLFVPLYSTKVDGQGIGLSFCRNIIEQHQGIIELHNNRQKGVTVMLIIPTKSAQESSNAH